VSEEIPEFFKIFFTDFCVIFFIIFTFLITGVFGELMEEGVCITSSKTKKEVRHLFLKTAKTEISYGKI
jgi:hypothetical protein